MCYCATKNGRTFCSYTAGKEFFLSKEQHHYDIALLATYQGKSLELPDTLVVCIVVICHKDSSVKFFILSLTKVQEITRTQ